MVVVPVLAATALGVFAYRHKRDPVLFLLTMLSAVALFLTTPFLGYLDDVTCLFLLAMTLPFLGPARTSWGARSALALLMFLAMLTHPTTTGLFVLVLLAAAGLRWAANRFSIRATLQADGPTMLSAAIGVVGGAAFWKLGLWGAKAAFGEAVLAQPYTAAFFKARLNEWVRSMHPAVTGPLVLLALGWLGWMALRRRDEGRDWHARMSVLWLLPLAGAFGFLAGRAYPYYRFINPTLAIMLLLGVGLWVVVLGAEALGRRLGSGGGRALRWTAVVVVLAALGLVYLKPGLRSWSRQGSWVTGSTLTDLSAASAYAAAQPGHPIVFVLYPSTTGSLAWGQAKQSMNITLGGLSGEEVRRTFFFVGSPSDLLALRPTRIAGRDLFNRISRGFLADAREGLAGFTQDPVVFSLDAFNAGAPTASSGTLVEVVPRVGLVQGSGVAVVSPAARVVAQRAAAGAAASLANPPSDVGHLLRVLAGLALLIVAPGLLAARWFELNGFVERLVLVPGLSIALVMAAGVVVVGVHRSAFGAADGWATAVLAVAAGAVLGLLARRRASAADPTKAEGPTGTAAGSTVGAAAG
jgi:hypothetical protein